MSDLGTQEERVGEINAAYASNSIDQAQHEELLGIEANTTSWVKLRYAGLAALCLTVGLFFLLS